MMGRRGRENRPESLGGGRRQRQQPGKSRHQEEGAGLRELGKRIGAGFVILMPIIVGQVYAGFEVRVGLACLRAGLAGLLKRHLPIRFQAGKAGGRRADAKAPMQQEDDYQR